MSGYTGVERDLEGGSIIEEEEDSEGEEMARKEESELTRLMRFMVDRDDKRREEEDRRREEERERRREEEEKHRQEERDRRREVEERRREQERAWEQEMDKRREEEAQRRREEEEYKRVLRREEEESRNRRELQQDKLKVLGSYKESTELLGYLEKFERIMRECRFGEDSWAERLFPRLPERLCLRVSGGRDSSGSYEDIKKVLLKSVGETPLTYGHQLFDLTGELVKSKTAGEICELIERICRGVLQGCMTLEQCVVSLAVALTRKVIPQAGKVYLETKKIETVEDLRDAWETWMSGRQKGNFFKPWTSSFGSEGRSRLWQSESHVNKDITCFSCGEKGHRSTDCKKSRWSGSVNGGSGARPTTCFNCGEQGHRSVDCTNKRVGGPVKKEGTGGKVAKLVVEGEKDNVAWGIVNGTKSKVLIDTGASVGVVPRSLLKENYRDCGAIHVADVHGNKKVHRSTVVTFELGGLTCSRLAMIDEREGEGVTSIVPMNLTDSEEYLAFTKAIKEYRNDKVVEQGKSAEVNVLTRSQARQEEVLDQCEGDVGVGDLWCTVEESDQKEQGVEKEPSEELGEAESKQECLRESVVEGGEELEGEPRELEQMSVEDSERELSELAGQIGPMKKGNDGSDFRRKLLADDSLKTWRELGTRNDLLIRGMYVSWEEFVDVIVVPKEYRRRILELSHEKSGHLGGEKVARMVSRYFLWPGMVKEIEEHCRSCETCQRKSKHRPKKVPVAGTGLCLQSPLKVWRWIWWVHFPRVREVVGSCLPTYVWLPGGLRQYHSEASQPAHIYRRWKLEDA